MIKGNWKSREITINGKILLPSVSQEIVNHSPDGFNWSYGGSGPAQLALAILLEFTDKKTACNLYQDFKWGIIAMLPAADFELPIEIVKQWISDKSMPAKAECIRRYSDH